LNQPYSVEPWNYPGTEEVSAIPGIGITDWVLIELRDAVNAVSATNSTVIGTKAAFIEKDGTVTGIDASDILSFETNITNQLFVVIRHRDHIAVMSATSLSQVGGIYTYDFTDAITKAHGSANGYKEIAPNLYGMVSGDLNSDGVINNSDVNADWKIEAGLQNYLNSDFNLDSQVDNKDKNDTWHLNSGVGYQSQVPE
jgi:hypothetical protein